MSKTYVNTHPNAQRFDMGELVDFKQRLKALSDILRDTQWFSPESLGWYVAERADDGTPVRYFSPRHAAMIGYVPEHPDTVYLDYRHTCRAYDATLEQLAFGLETGLMPDEVNHGAE